MCLRSWKWRAAWLTACVALLGCRAGVDETASADTSLGGTHAPAGATLASMTTVPVAVDALVPAGSGPAPWVKVSLDEAGEKALFLGRVRPGRMPALPMAVPVGHRALFFEVYDEHGTIARGERVLR